MVINDRDEDARRRLTARYAAARTDSHRPPLTAHELVQAVATAAIPADPAGSSQPAPRAEDLLDALTLVAAARNGLEYAELTLLDAGRRAELTWEALGEALGYAPSAARQGASGRVRRLLERWPAARASRSGSVLRQDQGAVDRTCQDYRDLREVVRAQAEYDYPGQDPLTLDQWHQAADNAALDLLSDPDSSLVDQPPSCGAEFNARDWLAAMDDDTQKAAVRAAAQDLFDRGPR